MPRMFSLVFRSRSRSRSRGPRLNRATFNFDVKRVFLHRPPSIIPSITPCVVLRTLQPQSCTLHMLLVTYAFDSISKAAIVVPLSAYLYCFRIGSATMTPKQVFSALNSVCYCRGILSSRLLPELVYYSLFACNANGNTQQPWLEAA